MLYPNVDDQPDLAQLMAYFDSDDVFVKSIQYETPADVGPGILIAPNAAGAVRILFMGFETIASLELALTEVICLAFAFQYEMTFKVSYDAFLREYTVTLNGLGQDIRSKGLFYTVQVS